MRWRSIEEKLILYFAGSHPNRFKVDVRKSAALRSFIFAISQFVVNFLLNSFSPLFYLVLCFVFPKQIIVFSFFLL